MQQVILKIFFFLLLFGNLIPRIAIGSNRVGVEDIVALISIPVLGRLFIHNIMYNRLIVIAIMPLCIFVPVFLFYGLLQSFSYLGVISFPSELWQYIKRIVCFLIAVNVFYNMSNEQKNKALTLVLLAIFMYFLVGVLQFFGFDILTSIYGRTDKQIELGLYTNHQRRIFGVAGLSNAWGGLSVFMFFATIGLVSLKKMYADISKVVQILIYLIYIVAVFNIFGSGSRGAWISFAAGVIVFYLMMLPSLKWKNLLILPAVFIILAVSLFILNTYFEERIAFMLFRFDALTETSGGGRDQQIMSGLSLINGWYEWLAGVSNVAQRTLGQSFGIESEPFNILVNYGVIGFALVYLTILNIIVVFRKLYNRPVSLSYNRLLYVSMFVSIFCYMLFSAGYFYFAELIVGIFSWLVYGAVIGVGLAQLRDAKEL